MLPQHGVGLVLALQVTRRGELLRAADALAHAQRHLLWMVRLAEGRTEHWLTPSRNAEKVLPAEVVAALHAATSVPAAIKAMWTCGRRYWEQLAPIPSELFDELDAATEKDGPDGTAL